MVNRNENTFPRQKNFQKIKLIALVYINCSYISRSGHKRLIGSQDLRHNQGSHYLSLHGSDSPTIFIPICSFCQTIKPVPLQTLPQMVRSLSVHLSACSHVPISWNSSKGSKDGSRALGREASPRLWPHLFLDLENNCHGVFQQF